MMRGSRQVLMIYASGPIAGDASSLATRGAGVDDWFCSIAWGNTEHKFDATVIGSSAVSFRQLVSADLAKMVSYNGGGTFSNAGAYWIIRGPLTVDNVVVNATRTANPTVTTGYTNNTNWLGHFAVCRAFGSNGNTLNNFGVTSPAHVNGAIVNESIVGHNITGQLMLPAAPYAGGTLTWHASPAVDNALDDLKVYEFRG